MNYKNWLVVALSAGLIFGGLVLVWLSSLPIPDLGSFQDRIISQGAKIYDRTGKVVLYDTNPNITRTIVPFDEISRNVKNATIAIEDAEFYEHNGIKIKAIIRAVIVNLFSFGYSQGGSTITQQVVKNSLLTQDKLISRKLKEWFLAVKIEQVLSKDKILEAYLNETPYGGRVYGVEEASLTFFAKKSKDLTIAESAYLAALPQAPSYYSPYGNHKDELEKRKNLVLSRMKENGFISENEYKEAQVEKVSFQQRAAGGIKAPHFVFFVIDYLQEKYGKKALEENGFRVITTLDYELQQKAEEITKKYALENKTKFNAENASLVAIDPKTGEILTMVGSRDYFDEEIDGNFNIALAHRQPGSSFKPFVYAAAFNKGYTPKTVVFDLETEFSTDCTAESEPLSADAKCYSPQNYDNIFKGPVKFEEALAESRNVPAVKVLYLTGINTALGLAKKMGIETLGNKDQYGLTLVLGGGEVSLLDMTSAYGVFANEGIRNSYQRILRIEDSSGDIVEEPKANATEVLPRQTALQISQILSSEALRAPAFGANSFLNFPGRDVADKTGTTNDYKDAWIIGYTPSLSVGAWAGNNDNTPMEKKVAGFIVAPMWNAFMQEVLKKYPDEKFSEPDPEIDSSLKPILRGVWQGGGSSFTDIRTGLPATEDTPPEFRKEILSGGIHSILYWVDKDNPRGAIPENPNSDPQFRLWEPGVINWVLRQGVIY